MEVLPQLPLCGIHIRSKLLERSMACFVNDVHWVSSNESQ